MRLDAGEEFRRICQCIRAGDVAKAQTIYQCADMDQPMANWDMRTPLQFAIVNDNMPMVKFLLYQCHADPSVTDDKRRNALHHAVLEGNEEVVQMLIDHGRVDFMAVDQWKQNALHLAALCDNLSVVKLVIKQSPESLLEKQADGRTPYEVALMNNNSIMAQLLAKAADSLNTKPAAAPAESGSEFESSLNTGSVSTARSESLPEPVVGEIVAKDHGDEREKKQHPVPDHDQRQDGHDNAANVDSDDIDRESLDGTSSRNNIHLRSIMDAFAAASDDARSEFENGICSLDSNCTRDVLDGDTEKYRADLDQGRNLSDHDTEQTLQQVFEFWGLDSIQAEIAVLQVAHPEHEPINVLGKTVAHLLKCIRGIKYPSGVLDTTHLANAIDTLRQLCDSEQQNALSEMVSKTERFSSDCLKSDAKLELLKEAGDFAAVRTCEEATEKMFKTVIDSSKSVLDVCTDQQSELEIKGRFDQIRESARLALGTTNGALRQKFDCVRHNVAIVERNHAERQDEISNVLTELNEKEGAFQSQIAEDDRLRENIAKQIEQLLQAEIGRQKALDSVLIEKKKNDMARRQMSAILVSLQATKAAKLNRLESLGKVYDQSMKAVEGFHNVVTTAVDTSQTMWAKRRTRIDTIRRDQSRLFAKTHQKYVRRMRESIRQEETFLNDIEEELEFNIKSQERAVQRGRLSVPVSLDGVVNDLRDEQSRVLERCRLLKSNLNEVERSCQWVFDNYQIAKQPSEGEIDLAMISLEDSPIESP